MQRSGRTVASEEARGGRNRFERRCGANDRLLDLLWTADERRHVDHEERVDLSGPEDCLQRLPIHVRAGGRDQVDRVPDTGAAGREGTDGRLQLVGQLRHLEPCRDTGIGSEDPGSAAVAHDRDSAAGRKRLVHEEAGGVEQLLECVDAHHAGLAEQLVDRDVGVCQRGGVGGRTACPGQCPAALEREDRFRARDTPREAGELARVAERLEVQEDDVGVGIVLPVLEQIIAADVGLVAERHEGRHSEVQSARSRQQLDSDAARLRREPHATTDGRRPE